MYKVNMELNSSEELCVIEKALAAYRDAVAYEEKQEQFLATQKFPMNTIISKVGTKRLDAMFGVGDGTVGKIVGWDFENNYYRVYYSERNPYVGVREEALQLYTGEVPQELKNYNPKLIPSIRVDLREIKNA